MGILYTQHEKNSVVFPIVTCSYCTCESWDIMEALCVQRTLPQVPRSKAGLLSEGLVSLSLLSMEGEVPWELQGGMRRTGRWRRDRIRGVGQCDGSAGVQGDGCSGPLMNWCTPPYWIKEQVQIQQWGLRQCTCDLVGRERIWILKRYITVKTHFKKSF